MALTWDSLTIEIDAGLADSSVKCGLLEARLIVLEHKGFITTETKYSGIQAILKERYNVEYTLSDIEDTLLCMHEDEKSIAEEEEDYYDGY